MKVVKRRRFNKRKFMTSLICTLAMMIIMPVLFQSVASGGTELKYQTIQVQTGDSLWNIASQYTPRGKDVRATVDKIKDFNNMEISSLSVGQEIKIPSDI